MSLPVVLADNAATVYHEFARLESMTQWWHWLLLVGLCAAVLVYIAIAYFYDSVELPQAKRWTLLALRVAAFVGVLFFFLDLEKRSQREVVKNSRALLLLDTSLSMGIQDEGAASGSEGRRRIDMVIDELAGGELISQLRAKHDVVAYRFDQSPKPDEIASLPKTASGSSGAASSEQRSATAQQGRELTQARGVAAIAGLFVMIALAGLVVHFVSPRWRSEDQGSWGLLVSMVALIIAAVALGVANLRYPQFDLPTTLGLKDASPPAETAPTPDDAEDDELSVAAVDWETQLTPRGAETRLGDAVRHLVNQERDGSIAGIVVVTDGGNNAGIDYEQSVAAARNAGIPLYTVGLGGAERPANVRIVDVEAPPRIYPGDSFTLNGYLQSYGLEGRTVKVELVSAPEGATESEDSEAETFEEQRSVKLGPDGEMTPVRFEVTPTQQGQRNYYLRVEAPEEDHDARDNERSAKVQIVQRKNRVMLLAGGPTREFRFLRNLLHRDRDTTLHVHLQTGAPGISQETDKLLYEFPETADELFEYDCIVAFDPDWLALGEAQIQLLERWVAEKAGGLILVAGPVHTPQWTSRLQSDSRLTTVKGLYPVVFYNRGSATLSLGRFASDTAWPLEFTREGREAEFLWLEDDSLLSEQAWNAFSGVYGYYAVKDPKPGARVYARFSDPNTSLEGELPIYLAGQFYGAGRVFFQASGEMWRVRAVDDAYFQRYYTKLIRWASQGRLLRDSSRGVLLVDKARCLLGDHVAVRAILTDAQHEPLTGEEVTAMVEAPDGDRTPLTLRRVQDAEREGMFASQLTASLEGDYRIELQPPHSGEGELLRREVRARIPELETERPERNDVLLKYVAEKTGGAYYIGLDTAMSGSDGGRAPIANLLEPQDQSTYVAGAPDKEFDRLLMTWLLAFICGALCLEWIIRRLNRLA